MIKIGDKLLCKRNLNALGGNFEVGNYYNVHLIDNNKFYLSNYKIYDPIIKYSNVFGLWFVIEDDNIYRYVIWDYFYNPIELRKRKIKEIEKNIIS